MLDASGATQLVVPGGTFLTSAEYVREGSDLLLIGADGRQVLIRDFFAGEVLPDLISDTGLRISGDLAARLAGPESPGQFAQAQAQAQAGAAQPIGRVETLEGSVTASRVDGTQATLEAGSPIFQGDVLETGAGATVGVIFVDDSTFALDESGRMVIDELVFDPGKSEGSSAFSVVQGAFTFVSGKIASSGPDNMVISTPVATIGVRGTVAGGVAGPEGTLNTVTLLSDGEISITNATGTTTLNLGPGQTLQVQSYFTDPGQPIILTTAQINNLLGGAIGATPASPGGQAAAVPDAAATAATQAAADGERCRGPGRGRRPG